VARKFNTAGPCEPDRHHMVDPIARLPGARRIVQDGGYFVVHAPRQTGKTTTLRALARVLTAEGRYTAAHVSCEVGAPFGDDTGAAELAIRAAWRGALETQLPRDLLPPSWPDAPAGWRVAAALRGWSLASTRPIVLFLDEIDALRDVTLSSVLRQLRDGFPLRPKAFPWSVALCGLRDVRDYKAASGGDASRLGTSSPFNIKVASLRIGDFEERELGALYAQHTEETGQRFEPAALARAFELTRGQPWLVNALAREVVEEMGVPPPEPISADHIEEAKERIILARQTHLDSLVARLTEPRVRGVLEPVLAGTVTGGGDVYDDDVQYVRDLGLVAPDRPLRIANPIYREVIARVLSSSAEDRVTVDPRSFILSDGRLDLGRILEEFAAFWREHGDVLAAGVPYHEVAPQLVLMAYLQRIVNGGGYVEREYGIGRGRIDLCVKWPHPGADGKRAWQREALELKVWAPGKPDPLARGLEQLDGYLDGLGLETGVLVLFDRRPEATPLADRTSFARAATPKGRAVTVLRA
jgi:hypothetical protein